MAQTGSTGKGAWRGLAHIVHLRFVLHSNEMRCIKKAAVPVVQARSTILVDYSHHS